MTTHEIIANSVCKLFAYRPENDFDPDSEWQRKLEVLAGMVASKDEAVEQGIEQGLYLYLKGEVSRGYHRPETLDSLYKSLVHSIYKDASDWSKFALAPEFQPLADAMFGILERMADCSYDYEYEYDGIDYNDYPENRGGLSDFAWERMTTPAPEGYDPDEWRAGA